MGDFFGMQDATTPDRDYSKEFQTPEWACAYMVSLIGSDVRTILEPTKGQGNLVRAAAAAGFVVTAPEDYFKMTRERFDCVLANPPFSEKYCFGVPENLRGTGMRVCYGMVKDFMEMADRLVLLLPWFILSDSDRRAREIKSFGLRSITHMPRKTFPYCRIQTVVLKLEKGYAGKTIYELYDSRGGNQQHLFY